MTFSGHIYIKQIGHAILHIDKFNEDYLIPVPDVKVKNLLTGTPYPELSGTYHISSSNSFVSKIDFSGKGLFSSGKKNSFEAVLYHNEDEASPLYKVEGQWNDKFTFHDVNSKTDLETYDTNAHPGAPLLVADLSEQDPWESRKAWSGVIDALNKGDMQGTSDEKSKIEEGQRGMRKGEEAGGKRWQPLFFKTVQGDHVFDKLAAGIGAQLDADKTVGVWKFDQEKARTATKPYHGGFRPSGAGDGTEA